MHSELNFNQDSHILSCPFSDKCNLPKSQSLCNFPDYKVCPEYQTKLNTLRTATKILH